MRNSNSNPTYIVVNNFNTTFINYNDQQSKLSRQATPTKQRQSARNTPKKCGATSHVAASPLRDYHFAKALMSPDKFMNLGESREQTPIQNK